MPKANAKRRTTEDGSLIGATDVIFLLLIFFLLTSSLEKIKVSIKTDPPKRDPKESKVLKSLEPNILNIIIDHRGNVTVEKERIFTAQDSSWYDLYSALRKKIVVRMNEPNFVVRMIADNGVNFGRPAQVMSVCTTLQVPLEIVYEGEKGEKNGI